MNMILNTRMHTFTHYTIIIVIEFLRMWSRIDKYYAAIQLLFFSYLLGQTSFSIRLVTCVRLTRRFRRIDSHVHRLIRINID